MFEIKGPSANFDWLHATVKVMAPVVGTATVTMQEIEMPLANVFALAKALYESNIEWCDKFIGTAKSV